MRPELIRCDNPFLDRVEAIVGKLTSRRVGALAERRVSWVAGLQRELTQVESLSEAVPPKDHQVGGHLRPYLPRPPLEVAYSTLRPVREIDYYDPLVLDVYEGRASEDAMARYLKYIVRRLLFCHSVAIDDPLTLTLPREDQPSYATVNDDPEAAVAKTLNSLAFLARLRPLIASNLVTPVPRDERWYQEWWYRENGRAPTYYMDAVGYPELGSLSSSLDLNMSVGGWTHNLITEPVKEIVATTGTELERAPLLNSLDNAVTRVGPFIRHHGRLDFDLATDEMLRIGLAEVLAQEAASAGVLGSYAQAQTVRVRTLVELPIPAFDDIPVDAVLRLHRDSDAFAAWRLSLAQGLDRIARDVDLEEPDSEETSRQILFEHTWPTVSGLAKSKLAAPGLVQGGLQRLVLGALPVATGLLSHSPVVGIATAAGSAAVSTAWTYASSGAQRLTAGAANTILDALNCSASQAD